MKVVKYLPAVLTITLVLTIIANIGTITIAKPVPLPRSNRRFSIAQEGNLTTPKYIVRKVAGPIYGRWGWTRLHEFRNDSNQTVTYSLEQEFTWTIRSSCYTQGSSFIIYGAKCLYSASYTERISATVTLDPGEAIFIWGGTGGTCEKYYVEEQYFIDGQWVTVASWYEVHRHAEVGVTVTTDTPNSPPETRL